MLKIFPDIDELNHFAAEKFIEIGNEAIERRGKFIIALSGGTTPKSLYRLLASEKFKDKIEWKNVYFFLGDERDVLPDDAESNFRMANENLFEPLQIKESNVFRWQTELENAEKTAFAYDVSLSNFFGKVPRFDLILLGMGADGHTASLFPFTGALRENEKFAVANTVEKLNTERLTMTFPVINNAANVMFLIGGESKAEALKEVLQGDIQSDKFPSQNVRLNDGNLLWLVDADAARLLH